jgi:tape measure domain-containing protein
MAGAGNLDVRIRITADGSQAIVSLRRTEDATRNLGNTSRQAAGGLDSVAKSLAGLAAGYVSLQGLERLVSSLVTITDEAARLTASYNMIYGSAEAASAALAKVGEMANRAGIDSTEAAKAFMSMSAAAQGTALEAEAFSIFESVTLSLAKLGRNSYDTAGALKAVEQMMSKGTISAEELKLQLSDRLPGAIQAMADGLGVGVNELLKMLAAGEVLAEDALPKLRDQLNELYASAPMPETVAADWERFGNVISGPGGLAETVNKAIGLNEFLMDVLKDVTAGANAMNTALNNGQVASELAGWSEAFSDAATYAKQMAVGLYALADEWYRFVQAAAGADADQIKTLWEDLTMLVGGFADAMLNLPDNVAGVTYIIAAELDILSEKFSAHWDMIAASSDLLWDSLKLAVPETFAAIQKVVGEAVLWIGKKLQDLTTDMAEFARLAAELPGVGDFAAGIADQLEDLGTRLRDSTLAFMWDQYASANNLTEQLREEVRVSGEAVDAAGERVKGLKDYARQARETAADLINLNEAERERANFLREMDIEAERIFAEIRAEMSGVTGNVAVSPSLTDDQIERLQTLLDQYVPGAKDARTLAEAQDLLNAAVAAGQIPQEEATRILAAMREEMDRKAASGNKAAESLANYANRVAYFLELSAAQKQVLSDILPMLTELAEVYGVSREQMIALVSQSTGFQVLQESAGGAIELLREGSQVVLKFGGNVESLVYGAKEAGDALSDQLSDGLTTTQTRAKQAKEASKELNDELNRLGRQFGTSKAARDQYEKSLGEIQKLLDNSAMSAEEAARALGDIRLEYQRSQGPMAEYLANLEEGIGGLEELGVNVMDSFVDTLADGLKDGRIEFEDFVDDVKGYLSEIVAKRIVLTFATSLGLGGSTAALAGSAGQSVVDSAGNVIGTVGGLSNLGTLGSLGSMFTGTGLGTSLGRGLAWSAGSLGYSSNWVGSSVANLATTPNWMLGGSTIAGSLLGSTLFDGGYSDVGSSIGSAAGTVIGSMIAGPFGAIAGSLLGGTGGGFLGSLFGDDTPKFGGYSTSFGSVSRFEDDVYSQGAFGLKFGVADARSENIDASDYQGTLDGLAAVSNTLADFYGGELESLVESSLRGQMAEYNKWGSDLDSSFRSMFGGIVATAAKEAGYGESKANLLAQAIGTLGGTAEEMANRIQGGIDIVNSTVSLFDTEVGKLLGLGLGEQFGSLSNSVMAMNWYIGEFRTESETALETISRLVTNVNTMHLAMQTLGTSLEEVGLSGANLVAVANNLVQAIEAAGQTTESFATLQSNYFNLAYTEAERAQMQLDSAMSAISDWSASIGHVGDHAINTTERLRAFAENINLAMPESHALYVGVMEISSSFVAMESALDTLNGTVEGTTDALNTLVADFIDSITPDSIKQSAALTEMTALFAQWGMQVPVTSEALYALIQAGVFTNAQLEALATNADQLGLAWTAIAAAQEAAIAELTTAYDEAVANAKTSISDRIDAITTASDERIAALREASDAALTTLRERYETLTGTLNAELDATQDALQTFSDVVDATSDALRSLTEQTDGIDETRQRALVEARSAIEQYATTGTLPDDITDTIGRLDTVDPNDFATRSEWLAAIAENAAVLSALEGIGAERVSEAERQIQLLEAQIEQAAAQYEASVDAENARLERLIAAEEAHRDALIAAVNQVQADLLARLQAEYDTQVEAIRSGDEATIAAIQQTNALLGNLLASVDALDLKIVNVSTTAMRSVPGFASGGTHAGGLRIVGELGPEIEYTGPSHVAPNSDLGGLFREGNSDVADKLGRVEAGQKRQIEQADVVLKLLSRLDKRMERWDGEGLPADREDLMRALVGLLDTEGV